MKTKERDTRPYEREIEKVLAGAGLLDRWNGVHWYASAHGEAQGLARKYALPLDIAAAVIAVLSPGTSWERNLVDADAVCFHGENAVVTTYNGNKIKALRILGGEPILEVLRGPKVRAFYSNILHAGRDSEVTIDGRAALICLGRTELAALNGLKKAKIKGCSEVKGPFHRACVKAYQRVAAREKLTPSQVQAITWMAIRNKETK